MLQPGLFERSGLIKANSIYEGHCGNGKDMPSAGQGWQGCLCSHLTAPLGQSVRRVGRCSGPIWVADTPFAAARPWGSLVQSPLSGRWYGPNPKGDTYDSGEPQAPT